MKQTLPLAFSILLTFSLSAQSALDPGRGQFFEQGYSIHENGLGNEIAIVWLQIPTP